MTKLINFTHFPDLSKKKNQLKILLKQHPTPFYIVDPTIIQNRYQLLSVNLKKYWPNSIIAYSAKTNHAIVQLGIISRLSKWIEVVSENEYSFVKKTGFKGRNIIYNGPYKSTLSLNQSIRDRAIIQIDNQDELKRIINISRNSSLKISVGLRLNVQLRGLTGSIRSRFGFPITSNQTDKIVKTIINHPKLTLTSLHIHIGSNRDKLRYYHQASKAVACYANRISQYYSICIKYLNFGGGFPSHSSKPFNKTVWQPQPIQKYISTISRNLIKYHISPETTLVLEPGRFLVDDGVIHLTKIISKTILFKKQIIICDSSITMLPLTHYNPLIIKVLNQNLSFKSTTNCQPTIIYGASCQESDVIYKGSLPILQDNDLIAIYATGAYHQTLGTGFVFNSPKTYII